MYTVEPSGILTNDLQRACQLQPFHACKAERIVTIPITALILLILSFAQLYSSTCIWYSDLANLVHGRFIVGLNSTGLEGRILAPHTMSFEF
jgi:hypothetical protein